MKNLIDLFSHVIERIEESGLGTLSSSDVPTSP